MKKILLLFVAIGLFLLAYAYDWVPKSNAELYGEMIEFAYAFADSAAGTKAETILRKFIARQERTFGQDPYAWIPATYKCVCELEALYPPVIDDGSANATMRRNILRLCDFPLHVHDRPDPKHPDIAGWKPPVEQKEAYDDFKRGGYMEDSFDAAAKWLRRPAPQTGELALFKVYNMGFLLRTDKHCIAFDIGRSPTPALVAAILDKVDVLFMSHRDRDHHNLALIEKMVKAGTTVVLSQDILKDIDLPAKNVIWENVIEEPLDFDGIQVRILAGVQGKRGAPSSLPNNLYHVTMDGWVVTHTGDNSDKKLEKQFSNMPLPDVAIFNCWTRFKYYMDALKNCQDYNPSNILCVSSHENEVIHGVMGRESWWEMFTRMDRCGDPDYEYPPIIFMNLKEELRLKK